MLPTSTNVSIKLASALPRRADAVVIFVTQDSPQPSSPASTADRRAADALREARVIHGKARETYLHLPAGSPPRRLLAVGLGASDKVSAESLRQAAGALAATAHRHRLRNIVIPLPKLSLSPADVADALVTGFLLASFDYEEYKGAATRDQRKKEGDSAPAPTTLTLLASAAVPTAVRAAVDRARILADAQNFSRTIASRPGNNINPPTLARLAAALAREIGLRCRVLDERQLRRLGAGGILAVGSGSASPPRLIALEHRPPGRAARAKPLLVVGKSITFDAGGISIKPADKMGRMIFDKCGGMTVLGFMVAAARLKLPLPVVGILTSAENLLGSHAYRPGDVLKMYNGVTVEVTNTDAEGRLVLGDALAWGIETYRPAAVVDLATLTGGVIVALGNTVAGVMSNSDKLVDQLAAAAARTGEKIWRLPLGDEYRDLLKSDFADVINAGGRAASPIQGGAFLSFFVPADGSIPWAHLDIAGVADSEKDLPYIAKGATGWGVRTLYEWAAARG